jgi:hypothetical protein
MIQCNLQALRVIVDAGALSRGESNPNVGKCPGDQSSQHKIDPRVPNPES